jgi:E1A/CREB-binding protein
VYISYLDSIQYMMPSCYRTTIYQGLIVEYLRYVKQRGFHTAHIWSCPPAPGDDYIFHCHPSKQLIPRDEMLRKWYLDTLEKAKDEGIVINIRTMHEEYFEGNEDEENAPDPTCLPYFEGDYIPGELENIIKQVSLEETGKFADGLISKREVISKGKVSKKPESNDLCQDLVMQRLGKAMGNMKQNFLVAHLRSRSFAAAVERGDDVSNWMEEGDLSYIEGICMGGKNSAHNKLNLTAESERIPEESIYSIGADGATDQLNEIEEKSCVSSSNKVSNELHNLNATIEAFAASTMKKTLIGDTIDKDEPQEIEMFESRQQFLNYCQTNHFQFDELRRAKHTSMMILFQLHHPHIPKFIPQCGACFRDITYGSRYHCKACSNFDLCEACFKPVTSGQWVDRGPQYCHDKSHEFATISVEAHLTVQKSREDQSRTFAVHLKLLSHTARCEGPPKCTLNNCSRMKNYFDHLQSCKKVPKKSCKICNRLLALLTVHARSCDAGKGKCPLPYCDRIREVLRRRHLQQQQMDDRRRQAQNQRYRDQLENL